ncbi:MAG: ABC transporter ATP-binding protein [Methanotrichaceae archaeon]|nr:ABC transporter ATP-binding protein [Methanotrichaceae archaeon]
MLEIKDLVVSFNRSPVLNGIDLSISPGDSLAIIGESGAGKSTLGLSIIGLVEGEVKGRIQLGQRDLLTLSEDEMRSLRGKEIGMVFQNVEDALNPLQEISDQVTEAMTVHGFKADASNRSLRLLEAVGLDRETADKFPHQMSGGEKQRALIAMALANDPQVLILDEPTASLDALTKSDILDLLRSAVAGKMALVITHDIATAAKLCNKIAVLYAGKVVETGRTEDLLSSPRHPYTRGLIRSYPNMTTTKDLQGIPGRMAHGVAGCPFHRRCTQKIEICTQQEPKLLPQKGRMIACHRGGIVPLLELDGVNISFEARRVLSDVSLTLYEGETLAVVGESGSGKTTLARAVIGLYQPDSGGITLEEKAVTKRDLDFYKTVQMIYQNPKESLSHRMNVFSLVKEPLDVQRLGSAEEKALRVKRALGEVELPADDDFLGRYPHQLSGGEAQRVAIARAMVLEPKLLIADEPTSALDASVQAKILRLLMDLQEKRGLSILFITHDLALARKVSDRLAVLHRGKIVEEGPTSAVISYPRHEYTRVLLEHASNLGDDRNSGWSDENVLQIDRRDAILSA